MESKFLTLLLSSLLVTSGVFAGPSDELFQAVEGNDPAAVNATLAAGADVNLVHDGRQILLHAVDLGNFDAAQSLLQNKASLDIKDKDGSGPLHVAARLGYASVTQLIMEYLDEEKVEHKINGLSAFHLACQGDTRHHAHTVEMMLAHGASAIKKTSGGHTPYDLAHHVGNDRSVQAILEHIQSRHPQGYADEL